jgi:soluble lytic murein transglycosylase-like protein
MAIPQIVANILKVTAPTLLAGLAGPFAPIAAAAATAALEAWLPSVRPSASGEPPKAKPAEIAAAIANNADDPRLLFDLRKAEVDLQKLEAENHFKFAELEVRDREGARALARDTGLARPQFIAGMALVGVALLMLFGVVVGCVMALTGRLALDPAQAQIAIAAFGLIGTVVGIFQGVAVQVLGYFYGSSAGSRDKTDQLGGALEDMGSALAEQAQSAPRPAPAPPPVVVVPPPPAPAPAPAPPAPSGSDLQQGPFGGVRWRLTPEGVVLEGQTAPLRTVGQPATVRRIWQDYGPLIAASCAANGVPLEIVVATIATESRGKPRAVLVEPDKRISVGLMQPLTGTASEVMGREITAQELNDPALNIEAGTRYIARQRPKTGYQPPLVAAAYNAGGLHKARESDDNPFNLRSTGDHILRLCQYFGDSCAVAVEEGWSHAVVAPAA